ncbi:MAG: YceG family conserved hypothetical protein [Rhodobacteraceae bacterium HLUCCA08]|nr:MAG: YceG family conserved hypothetical protein [Rhodobacteraceae bacterium HLUCCA08]
MWRHIAANALSLLIVVLFLAGGLVVWGSNEYRAEGPLGAPICLQVPRGASMGGVSEDLVSRGAVSSDTLFRIGADYAGKTGDLKAGAFLVPAGASMEQIVDIVTRGGASTCGTEVVYRVGVTRTLVDVRELDPASGDYVQLARFERGEEPPAEYLQVSEAADTQFLAIVAPGVTSWTVVQELNAIPQLAPNDGTVPPEGALAPADYAFQPGDAAQDILDRMVAAQDRILAAAWDTRAAGLPYETPQEALIMASIVEKETGLAEERGRVASVFVNRLNQGIKLQTDPTVVYGITLGEGNLGRGLRQSELRAATAYNTYVIDGLPPTPIANPGRDAIEAALNPDATEFLFFVAATLDPADGHIFAETYDQHRVNVEAYRALEAEAAASGN